MQYNLETAITEVTVYPDRVLVTRQAVARLEAEGEHTLRIGGLPRSILTESLRATGRGPSGTRILAVEQAAEFHAAAPEETLQRLRNEIDQLRRQISLLDERDRLIEQQQGWLRSMGEQSARSLAWGLARGTAKPEDASGLFTYTREEAERLATARQEIAQQGQELQRTLAAREREYREQGGGGMPDRIAADVRVQVPAAGEVTLELSYLALGASWHPRYDVRVDTAKGSVHLTQQALVQQQTGEDWQEVALALSTARPSAAVRLPDDPDPWYLDVVRPAPPPPQRQFRRMAAMGGVAADTLVGAAQPMAAAASAMEKEISDAEVDFASAEVEQAGAAQIFRLAGRSDVPSDGSPHTLGIGDYDVPCKLEYVAEPVEAEGAHLRAAATNSTGQVLLPGELHVFHVGSAGDEYIGATHMDLTAEGAELPLYLGVDDNVTVKRELIERDTDKGILLQSGIRKVTISYRVTLANRTQAPQHVILKDRLPVPRHERIKVRTLDIRPQPTEKTRLEQLTWDLQLPPGEERKIEWRFVVEAPHDLEIAGLP
ncbi:MAG TPA: mucoidy inhibitor MuiA family protein [Ktedonobacterales bacterium]|nr:mucoidy inhibitor MuiA family protein [Ktedonobacterales bacterium]